MPILEIEIVVDEAETLRPTLASELADAVGEIFGSAEGQTWVRLRTLPISNYSENGGLPDGVRPVFVTVLKAYVPEIGEMREEAARIAHEFGKLCQRPEANVHVIYQPDAIGRIAFGGRLVTD